MKQYRIKTVGTDGQLHPVYLVQVRTWWGLWITVKAFDDPFDPEFAKLEAVELLEHLREK